MRHTFTHVSLQRPQGLRGSWVPGSTPLRRTPDAGLVTSSSCLWRSWWAPQGPDRRTRRQRAAGVAPALLSARQHRGHGWNPVSLHMALSTPSLPAWGRLWLLSAPQPGSLALTPMSVPPLSDSHQSLHRGSEPKMQRWGWGGGRARQGPTHVEEPTMTFQSTLLQPQPMLSPPVHLNTAHLMNCWEYFLQKSRMHEWVVVCLSYMFKKKKRGKAILRDALLRKQSQTGALLGEKKARLICPPPAPSSLRGGLSNSSCQQPGASTDAGAPSPCTQCWHFRVCLHLTSGPIPKGKVYFFLFLVKFYTKMKPTLSHQGDWILIVTSTWSSKLETPKGSDALFQIGTVFCISCGGRTTILSASPPTSPLAPPQRWARLDTACRRVHYLERILQASCNRTLSWRAVGRRDAASRLFTLHLHNRAGDSWFILTFVIYNSIY